MNFKEELQSRVANSEQIIKKYLPMKEGFQKTILEAMEYSVEAGGKRLRPIMMMETYQLFGGKELVVEPFMAAMEMIHTYSLVHDDLPAMDNDEYRRGKKTTHVVYGEAMAILAGDALLNYAFETVAKAFSLTEVLNYPRVARAFEILSTKAGIHGMIGGQVVDVESEKKGLAVSKEQLLFIHECKTAALIQASLMVGAALAGADEKQLETLESIGSDIGLAFQIQDDILDIEGNFEELGKPIGSDEKNEKVTYVSLFGIEKSKADVAKYTQDAVSKLRELSITDSFLEELLLSLVNRTH